MCGRYAIYTPAEELRRLFGADNPPPNLAPSWNMAPTRDAPVVRLHPQTRARHLDALRWGLLAHHVRDPKQARQPINARAETVATSPLFRSAYAARRCLVPVDAFYEWKAEGGTKQPHAIAREDGAPMALAGIWEGWRGPEGEVVRSFAILTTAANATLRALHERMPVILEPADWPLWLGETGGTGGGGEGRDGDGDPATLLRPSQAALRVWAVSREVNNVRNDAAGLLNPA